MSSSSLSSLQLRVLSALVLAPVAIGAVYMGGAYFAVFLALATTAMSFEWCRASFKQNTSSYIILITIWLLFSLYFGYEGYIGNAFVAVLICACGVISLTWFRREEREWKGAFLGPIYIGVPVLCLMALRNDPEIGFNLTIFLFFIVWATDIGAYFA
ncbi:MAG: phosphatidate cytidylyltransferase, partial [Sneathiella sp.]|nr:phosphatidate cytidylyltransferase [Sneathiella sp.]